MNAIKALDRAMIRFRSVAVAFIWFGVASVAWFAFDREPPFEVLSVEPAMARPGEVIHIRAAVRRDSSRMCSAEMTQYIFDASKRRFDLGSSVASAELIRDIEAQTPGQMLLTMIVPLGMAPGDADLTSVLYYRCNKVHALWPIEVTTHVPFVVLP